MIRHPNEPTLLRVALTLVALGFLGLFLVLPLAVVFGQALEKGTAAYLAAIREPAALAAMRLTLLTAAIAVPLNLVFGVAAAWAIAKFDFRGRSALVTLIDLPFAISPVISGVIFVLLILPPKKFLLPPKEVLFEFDSAQDFQIKPPRLEPRTVIFGVHTCDLHAIQLLDQVFEAGHPDPNYINRRRQSLIISAECLSPCNEHSFCKSMGTLTADEGYDLHFTDIGESYAVRYRHRSRPEAARTRSGENCSRQRHPETELGAEREMAPLPLPAGFRRQRPPLPAQYEHAESPPHPGSSTSASAGRADAPDRSAPHREE